MFWKYNFGSSAQIETLLGKEDVTLHELMEEDELLQECKAQNRKLIEFLTREDVLQELVNLVVNEPPQDKEISLRFKYANLAAELLTSDVPTIIDKLVGSPSLLDVLYKFLEKEKPLNPLLASFFSKVLGMLVQRRSEQNWYSYQFTCFQVLDFLKTKGDFVEAAVSHVGTSAIMDLLLKLICNVEEDEIRQSVHQWFCENHLVERLLERLSPEADSDEHTSAGQILCEIVVISHDPTQDQGTSSPILAKLESEESVNKLLDLLLHEERNESSVTHVISVLLTLLNSRAQPQTQKQQQQQQQQQHQQQQQLENQQNSTEEQRLQSSSSVDSSDDSETGETGKYNVVARTIAKRLPSVQNLLLHPPKKGLLMTAYGQEMEPLGSTRLQVITFITALVMTNDAVVHNALAQLKTIEHLLDIFFKFLLNNFVHTQVEKCLTAIVTQLPPPSTPQSESSHPLLSQLITHCRIIQRIMEAHEQTDKEETKCPHNLKGYMGHLRQLANTIVQQAEFGPNEALLKQLIQDLPGETATQWDDFISNSLAEINRNNEVQQLPVLGMHHHNESDDDSDDDSNFYPQTQLDNPVGKQWISMLGSNLSSATTGATIDTAGTGDQTPSSWGVPPQTFRNKKNNQHNNQGDDDYEEEEEEEQEDNDEEEDEDDEDEDEDYKFDENRQNDLEHNEANIINSMVSLKGNNAPGNEKEKIRSKNIKELKIEKQVIIKTQIYTSKGFKEMDMETIGDFRYADDEFKEHEFKDPDDNLRTKEKDSHSSSDEEEEEEDEELSGIRNQDEKMDVDQDDWAEVFDKRSSGGSTGDSDNPWESAPMSDTSDNTGWADFGAFGGSKDPFGSQNPKKVPNTGNSNFVANTEPILASQANAFSAHFSNAVSAETTETTDQNAFQADFSNVDFDAKIEANCDVPKVTDGLQNSIGELPVVAGTEVSKEVGAHKGEEGGVTKSNPQETEDGDLTDNFNFLASRGLLKNESSEAAAPAAAAVVAVAAVVDASAAAVVAADNDSSMSVSSSNSSSQAIAEPIPQEGGNAAAS